jgi:TRAP-type C4-dicarboxylate transport system permease small subunit
LSQPARRSLAATTIVMGLGGADAWLAKSERAVTVVAMLTIVAMLTLQALLRYASSVLPLGEWLDPFRFMPPPDATLDFIQRFGLSMRRAAAFIYDVIVRGGGELARYSMVWAAVLGASVATREGRHIAVDAVTRVLEKRGLTRGHSWATVIIGLLTTLVVGYLAFAGWVLFQSAPIQTRESAALRIPIRYVAVVLPIGLGIMTMRFLGGAVSSALVAVGAIDPAVRYQGSGGLQALLEEYKQPHEEKA